MKSLIETRQSQIIAFGSFLVTVTVITSALIEPVNAPKMLALSLLVFALIGVSSFKFLKFTDVTLTVQGISLVLFLIWLWVATLSSNQSLTHSFYGTYGRNTGTLTYTLLTILFYFTMRIHIFVNQVRILQGLFYAGCFNLGYFGITLFGGEIFSWNNPGNRVLGTFGNSNFVGAFMAFFSIICLSRLLDKNFSMRMRIFSAVAMLLAVFQIHKSLAVQGYVILIVGGVVLCFFAFRQMQAKLPKYLFLFVVPILGALGFLGLMNKGPLASLIYKPSVAYRGYYWEAAWNMGMANPLLGLGPDSVGIYYRRFRSQAAVDGAGLNTATDAAHNVFLDLLAYGGIPLFTLYFIIQAVVAASIMRQVRVNKKIDHQFQAIIAVWLMYQMQSLVSINQIGIAIWGWVLGGLILAREKSLNSISLDPVASKLESRKKTPSSTQELLPATSLLKMLLGIVVGFAVAMPPVLADAKYFQAVKKGDALRVEEYSVSWPTNPVRIGDAANIFLNSGYPNKALELAEKGVQQFPDSFAAWKVLEKIPGQSAMQMNVTREVLAKLDPLDLEYRK